LRGALDSFVRPLRSLVGVYPLPAGRATVDGGSLVRPTRALASFCKLSSLAVVNGRSHLVVAGSEMGSLLVWDLRQKPRYPRSGRGATDGADGGFSSDPEIAHFEGPIWNVTVFSTDLFAFSAAAAMGRGGFDDDAAPLSISSPKKGGGGGKATRGDDLGGGGIHCMEISCVRCSDVIGGDSLVFALDVMGVVSFWRLLELGNVSHQSVKLALQGSVCLAEGAHLLGDFLGASYLCIHPQQQAQFVVVSTSGIRQTGRKFSASVADGPRRLELAHSFFDEEEPLCPSLEQPCGASFCPFFPGLLLVAYAEGDLALFDCSLCVPVTHWAGAIAQAPSRDATVAWSPRRPCVFFVKCGSLLDVWDLSENVCGPAHTVDLERELGLGGGGNGIAAAAARATCAELFVDVSGRPVVGHNGTVAVLGLPSKFTIPLQSAPPKHGQPVQPIDDLLVPGGEREVFGTLSRHCRSVDVPQTCALERDVMLGILASMSPLQAAV